MKARTEVVRKQRLRIFEQHLKGGEINQPND